VEPGLVSEPHGGQQAPGLAVVAPDRHHVGAGLGQMGRGIGSSVRRGCLRPRHGSDALHRPVPLHVRGRPDRGVQYLAIRYTERLADAGVVNSVESRGVDNALAETVNGLYKTELINRKGPWRTVEQVEIETAAWVH
jgi:hypothetical protein